MLFYITKHAVQAVADFVRLGDGDSAAPAALGATNGTSSRSFCGNQTVATSAIPAPEITMEIIPNTIQLLAAASFLCFATYSTVTGQCRKQYGVTFSERILSLAAFTVLQSLAFFISGSGDFVAARLSNSTCAAQGFLFQFAISGLFCEIATISYMSSKILTQQVSLDEIYRQERVKVFSFVYGVAFIFALVPTLVFVLGDDIPVYSHNNASVMCYLSDCTGAIIAFVFPLFLFGTVYSIVVCVQIVRLIKKTFRNTYMNKVRCLLAMALHAGVSIFTPYGVIVHLSAAFIVVDVAWFRNSALVVLHHSGRVFAFYRGLRHYFERDNYERGGPASL